MIWKYILCAIIGYLMGSISTGILLSKAQGRDIRNEGSKNAGATNALRVFGLKIGLLTFIGDCLKAVIAMGVAALIGGHETAMFTGLFVILGHNWPVFFQFKGGKGVACSSAVILCLFPLEGLIAILLCIAAIYFTRYISLGSMVMIVTFFFILLFTRGFWPCGAWALIIMVLGLLRHKDNVVRLLSGKENKVSFKKKP